MIRATIKLAHLIGFINSRGCSKTLFLVGSGVGLGVDNVSEFGLQRGASDQESIDVGLSG